MRMRIVAGLRIDREAPAAKTWKPIFDAADRNHVTMRAYENIGGCWTIPIPMELKPLFESRELRYPATQSFNARHIVFVNEDCRDVWRSR